MKQITVLVLVILLTCAACGTTSTLSPTEPAAPQPATPTQALISAGVGSPTSESIATETPTSEVVTLPAPQAIPQPAAAPKHQPGDPVNLDSINMFDPTNGWGLSDADVLVTSDGALTWHEVTPPQDISAGAQVQAQGAFIDEHTAWIIFSFDNLIPPDAVIWHTTDAGQSWTASTPLNHEAYGDNVWAEFSVLDATHIWLMVRGVYFGAGTHYDAQFFRTTDAGLTWSPLVGDVGVNYTGLAYADSDHGLITWQTTGPYAASPPAYAVTSDGGANWESRQLPPPPDSPNLFETIEYCEPYQPHLFSETSIRLLVGCFDNEFSTPSVSKSYLYSSGDFGSSWTSVLLPASIQASAATLTFFDSNNALLLNRDSYRTADGGQTWTYIKSVNWDGQFTFVNTQTGWAIARANDESALVNTSDGGNSWSVIKLVIGK